MSLHQNQGDIRRQTIGKNTIDHQFENASTQARYLILELSVISKYSEEIRNYAYKEAIRLSSSKWNFNFDIVEIVLDDKIIKIK